MKSLSPTMISQFLGSRQAIISLNISSTTSLREDQSSVTGCLEERQTHTHWMVFREESPTTSLYLTYPFPCLDLLSFHVSHLIASCSYVTLSLDPLLVVETFPKSLTTSPNNQFSVNCTARAELDGQNILLEIEWIRNPISPLSSLYTTIETTERGYYSSLITAENEKH